MKKVLVILYYWPPAGGGGVQRWLKFTKYLPTYGWEPVVYAPEDADYPSKDPALESGIAPGLTVIRHPIREPRRLVRRFTGASVEGNASSADQLFFRPREELSPGQKASLWARGNLFVPDARVLWVKPSARYLLKYLKDNPVDAIATTGPPHSVHLIGRKIKRETGVPWIADFRDPWTDIEYHDLMMMTGRSARRHRALERSVFEEADCVVGVSPYWEQRFTELGAGRVTTITNGFDPDDFDETPVAKSDSFLISHVGTLAMDRDPTTLWKALRDIADENTSFARDLKIEFVGKTDPSVVESARSFGLGDHIEDVGYVDHQEAIVRMRRAHVLLLLINRAARNAPGRMTGKIFEYLAAGSPILLVGPTDGDAAETIRACAAGEAVDFDDVDATKQVILDFYQRFKSGNLTVNPSNLEQFTRQYLSQRLVALLDTLILS